FPGGRAGSTPPLGRRAAGSRRLPPPGWRQRLPALGPQPFRDGLRISSIAPSHRSPGVSEELELAIDRTRCDGSHLCAELLPERIRLDDWGYPIIASGAIPAELLPHARRAVA